MHNRAIGERLQAGNALFTDTKTGSHPGVVPAEFEKMKKIYITTLLLFAAVSHHAGAVVLWEQAPDTSQTAVVDQEFPDSDFAEFSNDMVQDIIVTGDGWVIDSVTTFFTINPAINNICYAA
jgi:hypothetical protein